MKWTPTPDSKPFTYRVGMGDMPGFRGMDRDSDPGAVAPTRFHLLQNARLDGPPQSRRVICRGGQSKLHTAALSKTPRGIFEFGLDRGGDGGSSTISMRPDIVLLANAPADASFGCGFMADGVIFGNNPQGALNHVPGDVGAAAVPGYVSFVPCAVQVEQGEFDRTVRLQRKGTSLDKGGAKDRLERDPTLGFRRNTVSSRVGYFMAVGITYDGATAGDPAFIRIYQVSPSDTRANERGALSISVAAQLEFTGTTLAAGQGRFITDVIPYRGGILFALKTKTAANGDTTQVWKWSPANGFTLLRSTATSLAHCYLAASSDAVVAFHTTAFDDVTMTIPTLATNIVEWAFDPFTSWQSISLDAAVVDRFRAESAFFWRNKFYFGGSGIETAYVLLDTEADNAHTGPAMYAWTLGAATASVLSGSFVKPWPTTPWVGSGLQARFGQGYTAFAVLGRSLYALYEDSPQNPGSGFQALFTRFWVAKYDGTTFTTQFGYTGVGNSSPDVATIRAIDLFSGHGRLYAVGQLSSSTLRLGTSVVDNASSWAFTGSAGSTFASSNIGQGHCGLVF